VGSKALRESADRGYLFPLLTLKSKISRLLRKKVFLCKEIQQPVNKFALIWKTAFSAVNRLWKSSVKILVLN